MAPVDDAAPCAQVCNRARMLGAPPPLPFDPGVLRLSTDLRRIGTDPTRGGWHHVRHGVWVEVPVWSGLTPEQRHAALVHAMRHSLCTPAELAAAAAEVPRRVRGRPAALLVTELADARSMSPGESLSRAAMFRLNLPRPDLQVDVEDAEGLVGTTDFGWPGVVGEFDGRSKYGIPEGADPAAAAEVLWREKRREDRLRRVVRVARWTWADAVGDATMGRLPAEHGIRSQPRNTWFDHGARRAG